MIEAKHNKKTVVGIFFVLPLVAWGWCAGRAFYSVIDNLRIKLWTGERGEEFFCIFISYCIMVCYARLYMMERRAFAVGGLRTGRARYGIVFHVPCVVHSCGR